MSSFQTEFIVTPTEILTTKKRKYISNDTSYKSKSVFLRFIISCLRNIDE